MDEIKEISKIDETPEKITIMLDGKISAFNYEKIQTEIIKVLEGTDAKKLVFDMDKVIYVASAGLRMFSTLNQKAIELGKEYELMNARKDIVSMFAMTGYASAFRIEAKEE